ncbi:MAG: hypothetical protein ACI9JN_002574 [Bacteroidia bacterium]|jgi:hypothetical protein
MKSIKRLGAFIVFCYAHSFAVSQSANFKNDFNLKDYASTYRWSGDTSKFEVFNGQLYTASDSPNDLFSISKAISDRVETEWSTDITLPFATSSTNYVDYYLFADSIRFAQSQNNVFIRVGGTKDQLVLYQTIQGKSKALLESREGITHNISGVLRVTRTKKSKLKVSFYDSLKLDFIWSDSLIGHPSFGAGYLGISVKQSTPSFHRKHHFDNIYYGPIRIDSVAPKLKKLEVRNDRELWLYFNEEIAEQGLSIKTFKVNNGVGVPDNIIVNMDTIKLIFVKDLLTDSYEITVDSIMDLAGNRANQIIRWFEHIVFGIAGLHDVVISEVLPDPSPNVGLPEVEYLELTNRSNEIIDLSGWTISDKSKSVELPVYVLWPDSIVLVCDKSSQKLYAHLPNVVAVDGLISLNNSGDSLVLKNSNDEIVFSLNYTSGWHSPIWKIEGGWSLEMIDIELPCAGNNNWASTVSKNGGTPGTVNSIASDLVDDIPPGVASVHIELNQILLVFDESINYYEPQLGDVYMVERLIRKVYKHDDYTLVVELENSLDTGTLYSLHLFNIVDCSGNRISDFILPIAIGSPLGKGDLIINELFYDVSADCMEFIEIYNPTGAVFDMQDLFIGVKDTADNWQKLFQVSRSSKLIPPGSYWVITSDSNLLRRCKANATHMVQASQLPTFVNVAGNVGLSDKWGATIDAFYYADAMHFPLLSITKDVSLERINPRISNPTWTSAAQSHNYATPGYKNSQMSRIVKDANAMVIQTDPVSPNSDGYNDQLVISYVSSFKDELVNVMIYNQLGQLQAFPVNTSVAGVENQYVWDCVNEDGILASEGIYVVFLESISLSGELMRHKHVFTIVR